MTSIPAEPIAPDRRAGSSPLAFPALLARVLVGGLLAATGVAKLANLEQFAEEIQNYELAPIWATHLAALIVAPLEIVAGGFLLLGLWRADARLIVGLMLIAFTALKVYAWAAGKSGACGCGGGIAVLDALLENPQGIFTNLALLGLLGFDARVQRLTARPRPTAQDAAAPAPA